MKLNPNECIVVRGAREHNLKNVNVLIPRNALVVLTGLSGSGKSSLAFDTIYAEGRRRYVESLSSYARQFLGQMDKPDVDAIERLSPAISIDQKTTSHNPRSTVGTVTEIHDYLRLLYANIGTPHCPTCGKEIAQQTIDQMVDVVMALPEGTRIQVLAPVVRGRKGEHANLLDTIRQEGYVRVRIDGKIMEVADDIRLDKKKKHTIEVVVDRLVLRSDTASRLADSLETAVKLASGLAVVNCGDGKDMMFSQNYACADCGISIEELVPRLFSFNAPYGACPVCSGLGTLMRVDPDIVLPNRHLPLSASDAIRASGWSNTLDGMAGAYLKALSAQYHFSLDTPIDQLPKGIVEMLLYGTKGEKLTIHYERAYGSGTFTTDFEGIVNNLERRHRETQSDAMKAEIEELMSVIPCPECGGARFKKEVLGVTVGGVNIAELSRLPVRDARLFFSHLQLSEKQAHIARQILKEIDARLGFLMDVGLDYLTLSRMAGSLSGGEAQRIRLATQIGSALVGVLYILDEPSIGLHQRDNERLLRTLKSLRDIGNTLLVVEHDEDTMWASDYVIDVGPGAGEHGGEIVAVGTAEEICQAEGSLTGAYLSGRKKIPQPERRRESKEGLRIVGARENNLRDVDVWVPLGVMTCVTGVSGSGKSSLVNEILYKTLARDCNRAKIKPGACDGIEGIQAVDKVIDIDQAPIGRTPRSNPATYTGMFDLIRDVFAQTNDAKVRGYRNGRFSFNVKGGRCEACHGDGIIKIEMHFLPDVYVPCEVCKGKRYNRDTLEVRYKGKNIYEVLEMTVEEALRFFEHHPRIRSKLQTLYDVGLGYIRLGQPSTTLSGGEAQRIKLATELSRRATGRTVYILDEPTTGLHMADVERLIEVLQRLVDVGNTVVVIEHNLHVIKCADYLIDLGPEGGDKGGQVVATGTPEEVCRVKESYTGAFLKPLLEREKDRQETG